MSLYGALYTGVAGLSANGRAMAHTSTNIANVNTVGYKGSRNEFSSLIASNGSTSFIGGIQSVSLPQISAQGNILQTSSETDLAIAGQGFFVVTPTAVQSPVADELLFTRSGSFQKDNTGYLVNSSGMYLQGWLLDANGEIPTNRNSVELVNLGRVTGASLPTTTASLRANLQSSDPITTPYTAGNIAAGITTARFESAMEIFDTQGGSRPLRIAFVKTAANTWQYEIMYDGAAADIGGAANNPIATGTLTFNTDGTIATPAANVPVTVPFVGASGLAPQTINFSFGTPGQANGFTQFDTTSSLYGSTIDGTLYGGLNGVRIDDDGFVVAQFTNGIERKLYKLPVATFANADGLRIVNGNAFSETSQSGSPSMKNADEAGAGKIANKSVEQSTVDIAEEFSDMIIIQRAYSAASKIITTADEMLDELTRLKR
jgi:flagellar hook protein FlgE